MKKKIFTIALAIACVTTLTVGCGENTTTVKKTETKKEKTDKEKKEETVENGKIFYANQDGVQIHEKADYSSKVVETVEMNDEVMTIEDESNGFRKVTVNGTQGYVATAYLAKEKLTQTAQAVAPAPTTPDMPVNTETTMTPTTNPTAKPSTTTKPSVPTTTTKPSTPSTPAPAPAPTPAPAPAPVKPTLSKCPYTLLTYTTYDGHYGFFFDMQGRDQTKVQAMKTELYLANCEIDAETNTVIKYPTDKKTIYNIGLYSDVVQLVFYYVTK